MARILITDDSRFMRNCLDRILSRAGHEVFHATNGQEMLERYEELHPDIVMSDITMPVLDGISAVKILHQKHPEAKIIMCSAMGQFIMVKEAISNGARDFIIKPFKAEKVLEAVRNALR